MSRDEYSVSCCCCASVPTNTTGLRERWGQFMELLQPGLTCFWCCCEGVRIVPNYIQRMTNKTQSKTRDDVNVTVITAVQYKIRPEKSRDAYYNLQDPVKQIEDYIDNCVRSHVPKMTMNEVLESKDSISQAVKDELSHTMEQWGFDIVKTLVTDIILPANIVEAMNSKVQNTLRKQAAVDHAEALKIETTTAAEANRIATIAAADAEAAKMRKLAEAQADVDMMKGRGLARQRMEIIQGLNQAVSAMSTDLKIDPTKTTDVVLAVQYFDTLKEIGSHAKSVMVPYSNNPQDVLRSVMIQSKQVAD